MIDTSKRFGKLLLTGLSYLAVLLVVLSLVGFPTIQQDDSRSRAINVAFAEASDIGQNINALSTQTVTVTNTSDEVNGDTSSIADLLASPGGDGVSFREALLACNNTLGEKRIEFAPQLAGKSIYILEANSNWPVLTSSDLTISGDIDQDGQADITLDGTLGRPDSPTANALSIWSDDNTISDLTIKNFSGNAILFGAPNFYSGTSMTLSGNKIIGNTIENGCISLGPFGWQNFFNASLVSNLTWQDTLISGNHMTAMPDSRGGIEVIAAGFTANGNRILRTTIKDNILTGSNIVVIAADGNSLYGGLPDPIRYADNNLVQDVTISNNIIESVQYKGIEVGAGNMGNSNNQVLEVVISNNYISGSGDVSEAIGISIFSASDGEKADRMTANNLVLGVEVSQNSLDNTKMGIRARASDTNYTDQSPGYTGNWLQDLSITDNIVRNTRICGICLWGARTIKEFLNYDNLVSNVTIQGNEILGSTEPWSSAGIDVIAGWTESACDACVSENVIEELDLVGNEVQGFYYGLQLVGGKGEGAVKNRLSGLIDGNLCSENTIPLRVAANSLSASDNQINIEGFFSLYLPFNEKNIRP